MEKDYVIVGVARWCCLAVLVDARFSGGGVVGPRGQTSGSSGSLLTSAFACLQRN